MLARSTLTVQSEVRKQNVDRDFTDRPAGHPASDPAGADGDDLGGAGYGGREPGRWVWDSRRRLRRAHLARSGNRKTQSRSVAVRHRLHHLESVKAAGFA